MRILVSPLDWGLGHASRLSPVVQHYLSNGDEVVIAGQGRSLMLLQSDFPTLKNLQLKSFSPRFCKKAPQWLAISLQLPVFFWRIISEYRETRKIVANENIDLIISDNRYGVRSRQCKSILITHQLSPKAASWAPVWFNTVLARGIAWFANSFDEIWIPDEKPFPDGLAGDLANPRFIKTKVKTIGLLSRLKASGITTHNISHLAIISGPEPQRTIFENKIASLFQKKNGPKVIIRGITENQCESEENGIKMINSANPEQLSELISAAENIYCRSGYSTIMDLRALGRQAFLCPTPGQAEQEYLCKRMTGPNFQKLENID
ncbi:MAG: hypothetical protein MJZ01_06690 [Bacteroidales bacterium]|nr:hypothetical protein [Bacteroidales bacterium]